MIHMKVTGFTLPKSDQRKLASTAKKILAKRYAGLRCSEHDKLVQFSATGEAECCCDAFRREVERKRG